MAIDYFLQSPETDNQEDEQEKPQGPGDFSFLFPKSPLAQTGPREITDPLTGNVKRLSDSLTRALLGEPPADQSVMRRLEAPVTGVIDRTTAGLVAQGARGIARLAESVGMDKASISLRDFSKELEASVSQAAENRVEANMENFGVSRKTAETVAQVGDMLASGTVFSTLMLASGGLATPAMFMQGLGEIDQMAEDAGVPDEERSIVLESGAAFLYAQIERLNELPATPAVRALAGRFARYLPKGLEADILAGVSPARIIAKFGFGEALEEVAQQATEMAVVAGQGSGRQYTPEDVFKQISIAAVGGLVGSTPLGMITGLHAHNYQVAQRRSAQATDDLARARAQSFDPVAADPGTTIAGRTKGEDGRWREEGGSKFATPPTAEQVYEHYKEASKDADASAAAAKSADTPQPIKVTVSPAVSDILSVSQENVDPVVAELNVRQIAVNHSRTARRTVTDPKITDVDLDRTMADLQTIALDPTNGADYSTRMTALGKYIAFERARRNPPRNTIDNLNVSIGARAMAELSEHDFQALQSTAKVTNDPVMLRTLGEAQILRAAGEAVVQPANREVNKRLAEAATARTRGLGVGTQVSSPDGGLGTVQNIRNSGLVDVLWSGSNDPRVVDPSSLNIIPKAGQTVKLSSGDVVTVKNVNTAKGKVTVTLPNGKNTIIDVNSPDIEELATSPAAVKRLEETQTEQVDATAEDPGFQPLPVAIDAYDGRTGKKIKLTAVGNGQVQTSTGEILPRQAVAIYGGPRTLTDIAQTGVIPVFEPGTKPTSKNRHIGFMVLPEEEAKLMESHARSGNAEAIVPEGSSIFLFPQPQKPGTRLYAVEIPADARALTDASKKALGFLSGKKANITRPTMASRVRLSRTPDANEVGLMRVPEGLRLAANGINEITNLTEDEKRSYMRRLTDLGFDSDPVVTGAMETVHTAAKTAADARIAGRIGEAEVAEVLARVAPVEALQEISEADMADRQAAWESLRLTLRESLDDEEVSTLDILNASFKDDLMAIPGISESLADRIVEAREKGGKFETVDDLLNVKGIGPARLGGLIASIEAGEVKPTDLLTSRHDAEIMRILADMPGRVGTDLTGVWPPFAFEHPSIPDMFLTIDKEIVHGAERHDLTVDEIVQAIESGADPLDVRTQTIREADKTVYHIKYITPEGREVHARTIGPNGGEIMVPQHLARNRGGTDTPEAVHRINEGRQEGLSLDDIVEEMRRDRQFQRRVNLAGRGRKIAILSDGSAVPVDDLSPEQNSQVEQVFTEDSGFDVIDRADGIATVEDADGNRFEIPEGDIEGDAKVVQEPMVPVPAPIRRTDAEVLNEVMRDVRGFNKKVKLMATGEWYSQTPGVYAEIRPSSTKGVYAIIMSVPQGRQVTHPRTYEIEHMQSFEDEAAASKFLEKSGFRKTEPELIAAEEFAKLPTIEDATKKGKLADTHAKLTEILDDYVSRGFIPQPVRDYATRFALRWYQRGLSAPPGGLFESRNTRRWLNLFEVQDVRRGAQSGHQATAVRTNSPDVTIVDGRVVRPRETPATTDEDTRVLDGILLRPAAKTGLPAYLETAKKLYQETEAKERFLDMAGEDGPTVNDITRRLVDVDGRRGLVIDSRPGDNTMTVQVFEEGTPVLLEVQKKDVTRIRDPRKAMDYLRAARDGMNELTNIPVTPEIGESPYDNTLGLNGISDETKYRQSLARKVGQVLQGVKIAPDGNITGDATKLDVLKYAWIRMKELGISNKNFWTEEMLASGKIAGKYKKAIEESLGHTLKVGDPLIPPQLAAIHGPGGGEAGLLPSLAYAELANTFSTISPYGTVMAKAKLGLLSKRQEKQVEEQAAYYGFDKSLPLYRKVEKLMANVWDPNTAHLLQQMRRDIGALMILGDALPPQGLEFRTPAMGSSIHTNVSAMWTTPREMANRHWTIRTFHQLAERARTEYGNWMEYGAHIVQGLAGLGQGMSLKRKQLIWDILQSEEVGNAMERPSDILTKEQVESAYKGTLPSDWDWYKQYSTIRHLLVENRKMQLRNLLIRGLHPEEITLEGFKTTDDKIGFMQTAKQQLALTDDEVATLRDALERGEKFYDLDRRSQSKYSRSRDDVSAFMALQDTYHNLESIPNEVVSNMKDWMREEFDFWARYGIKNYAPHVIVGRHKIFMETPDGAGQLVAFAPDGATANEFFLRVSRGQVDGIPASAKLYVEYGQANPAYEDIQWLGPAVFKRLYAHVAKNFSGKEGEATRLFRESTKILRLGRDPALPRNIHAEKRVSDLSEVVEDPYRRLLLYHARVGRANFMLDVEHAYETARANDAAVSRATGIETIFPSEYGDSGHEVAAQYMRDLKDSYMGNPTSMDRKINRLIALTSGINILRPKQALKFISRMKNDPYYDLFSDPEFNTNLFNEDFAAKRWAEIQTGIQSVWRLGLNFGAAAVNSTQHLMFTASHLMTHGYTAVEAEKHALLGAKDAVAVLLSKESPEHERLLQFAHDVGVQVSPARGVAGPGLGLPQGKPLFFSDDGVMKKAGKFTEWVSLMPFSGAERLVRLSAAFSALRAADQRGLDYDASVEFARNVIDNTQFQYYDQALPPFMRNNLSRVLFQFQPFVINAIKFEKDLMIGALPESVGIARAGTLRNQRRIVMAGTGKEVSASSQARKAWLLYNATRFMFGGLAGVAANSMLTPLEGLWQLIFGQPFTDWIKNKLGKKAEDQVAGQFGTQISDPELVNLNNVILYGIPALLGITVSDRIGVSGMDLSPSRLSDMAFGPSGSVYKDMYELFNGESGFKTVDPAARTAGLVAAGAAQLVGSRLPFKSAIAGMTAAELVSLAHGYDLWKFMDDTSAGRHFSQAVQPRLVTAILHTIDMFDDNTSFDASFYRRDYVPGLNRTMEAATSLIGLQTVASAQERALTQYWLAQTDKRATSKRSFVEAAATTAMKTSGVHDPAVTAIIERAFTIDGVRITADDIIDEIQKRNLSAIERAQNRMTTYDVMQGHSNPGAIWP